MSSTINKCLSDTIVDAAFIIPVKVVKRICIQKALLKSVEELLVPFHYGCVNKDEHKFLSKNF